MAISLSLPLSNVTARQHSLGIDHPLSTLPPPHPLSSAFQKDTSPALLFVFILCKRRYEVIRGEEGDVEVEVKRGRDGQLSGGGGMEEGEDGSRGGV